MATAVLAGGAGWGWVGHMGFSCSLRGAAEWHVGKQKGYVVVLVRSDESGQDLVTKRLQVTVGGAGPLVGRQHLLEQRNALGEVASAVLDEAVRVEHEGGSGREGHGCFGS